MRPCVACALWGHIPLAEGSKLSAYELVALANLPGARQRGFMHVSHGLQLDNRCLASPGLTTYCQSPCTCWAHACLYAQPPPEPI